MSHTTVSWSVTPENDGIRLAVGCDWAENRLEIVEDAKILVAVTKKPCVIRNARGEVMLTVRTAAEYPIENDAIWTRVEQKRLARRPPKAQRRMVSRSCPGCAHEFLADSTDMRPEGHQCPECDLVSP